MKENLGYCVFLLSWKSCFTYLKLVVDKKPISRPNYLENDQLGNERDTSVSYLLTGTGGFYTMIMTVPKPFHWTTSSTLSIWKE